MIGPTPKLTWKRRPMYSRMASHRQDRRLDALARQLLPTIGPTISVPSMLKLPRPACFNAPVDLDRVPGYSWAVRFSAANGTRISS